jgi:glycerophosphoryl diester phosphodiesterase
MLTQAGRKRLKMRQAALLLLLCCLVSAWWMRREPAPPNARQLIAHALGGIDGHTYTNSLEAFQLNYANGFRLFEVDLLFLADQGIAAFHSLDSVHKEFGTSERIATLAKADFNSRLTYGKYHTLDLGQLADLARHHPEAKFVLDLKDSADRNNDEDLIHDPQQFSRLLTAVIEQIGTASPVLQQFIPQIYCEQDLSTVNAAHFFPTVIYTLYRTSASDSQVLAFAKANPQIKYVAFDTRRFSEKLARDLKSAGVRSLVYTVNSPPQMQSLKAAGAYGFYTDFIRPEK